MFKLSCNIKMDDGITLEQFSRVLNDRMVYLKETASQAVASTSINIFKSLRPNTRVAKPNTRKKIALKQANYLYPGFYRAGKKGPVRPCMRIRGSKQRFYPTDGTYKIVDKGSDYKSNRIFIWESMRTHRKLYIQASSAQAARAFVAEREKQRIARYAGLAKLAFGKLMHKISGAMNVNDQVSNLANQVAQRESKVRVSKTGDTYNLTMKDDLRYAVDALKHGESDISFAIKKALNKTIGIINHRLENNIIGQRLIPLPFPDIRGKRF